jgi:hypothetical protein
MVTKANTMEKKVKPVKGGSTEKNTISKVLLSIKNLEELKRDYDIVDEALTPKLILHKMSETLELYLKLIQQILQPEEFNALYECNAFNDKEKARLFDLYKQMIISHRELLKAVVLNEEKNILSTIQFIHDEIKGVKSEMVEIIGKMQESWKMEGKKDLHKGAGQYFG